MVESSNPNSTIDYIYFYANINTIRFACNNLNIFDIKLAGLG